MARFIVDSLESSDNTKCLSAKQGKALKELINSSKTGAFEVVEELPDNGDPNLIYLVKNPDWDGYLQYVYVSEEWIFLGTTNIDLSSYVTGEELDDVLAYYSNRDEVANVLQNYAKAEDLKSYAKKEVLDSYVQFDKDGRVDAINNLVCIDGNGLVTDTGISKDLVATTTWSNEQFVKPAALAEYAKTKDLDDYVEIKTLNNYVKSETLDGYVKTAALAEYAKTEDLDDYVETKTLNNYVKSETLDGYIKKDAKSIIDALGYTPSKKHQSKTLNVRDESLVLGTLYTASEDLKAIPGEVPDNEQYSDCVIISDHILNIPANFYKMSGINDLEFVSDSYIVYGIQKIGDLIFVNASIYSL